MSFAVYVHITKRHLVKVVDLCTDFVVQHGMKYILLHLLQVTGVASHPIEDRLVARHAPHCHADVLGLFDGHAGSFAADHAQEHCLSIIEVSTAIYYWPASLLRKTLKPVFSLKPKSSSKNRVPALHNQFLGFYRFNISKTGTAKPRFKPVYHPKSRKPR